MKQQQHDHRRGACACLTEEQLMLHKAYGCTWRLGLQGSGLAAEPNNMESGKQVMQVDRPFLWFLHRSLVRPVPSNMALYNGHKCFVVQA